MRRTRHIRVFAGIAIWCIAAVALVLWWAAAPHGIDRQRTSEQLWRYATGVRTRWTWRSEQPLPVVVGDPVFLVEADDTIRRIGEVTAVSPSRSGPGESSGRVLFYASAPPVTSADRLTFHETPRSMEWVLRTMLPPDKQRRISQELSAAFEQHHEEILDALRPVVEDALRDALPVVEQQLAEAIRRHEVEINRLGARYQREIVDQELIPLVREQVWPIVYRHSEPMAKEIGREIWERASLWRFGWRYAYDISPLPEKKLLEQEWERYVREDVTPVVDAHIDDIIDVQKRILADIARNEKVQQSLRDAIGKMFQDSEAQALVGRIVREALVDNPEVLAVLREHWRSEEAQRALRLASSRMEPTVIRIGEMLLGSPQEGISPEFARVLRHRVLRKDRRWLVLHAADAPTESSRMENSRRAVAREQDALPLTRGPRDAVYPFVEQRGVEKRDAAMRTGAPG